MSEQFYEEIFTANDELDKRWNLSSNNLTNLNSYRNEKLQILKKIMEIFQNTENLPQYQDIPHSESDKIYSQNIPFCHSALLKVYKLGITISCQITKTRVTETASDGYKRTEPSPVAEDIRTYCMQCYDLLLANIRQYDRMYLADIPERTAPDSEKRIALLRLYDAQKLQKSKAIQSNNRNINKLFGSRG